MDAFLAQRLDHFLGLGFGVGLVVATDRFGFVHFGVGSHFGRFLRSELLDVLGLDVADKARSDCDALFGEGINNFLGRGLGVGLEVIADGLGFVQISAIVAPCWKYWTTLLSQASSGCQELVGLSKKPTTLLCPPQPHRAIVSSLSLGRPS